MTRKLAAFIGAAALAPVLAVAGSPPTPPPAQPQGQAQAQPPAQAQGQTPAQTPEKPNTITTQGTAGPYAVTLEVQPVESFSGPDANMKWYGGAPPVKEDSATRPNFDMTTTVYIDGKILLNADIDMKYRRESPTPSGWQTLPVARMYPSDRGIESTCYGNNVKLDPGDYAVKVDVGGNETTLHFTVAS